MFSRLKFTGKKTNCETGYSYFDMFYFDNEQYRDDDYIKRRVNDYKVNSSSTGIIPEYIQYNKANPYKKN